MNPYAISGASTSIGKGTGEGSQGRVSSSAETTSSPALDAVTGPCATPVCNAIEATDEELQSEIARLQEQLAARRPPLRLVKGGV